MKILHVLAQLPSNTGSGVYYSNLIEGLEKYSYEQKAIFAYQDDYNWTILNKDDQYPLEFKTEELPFPIAGMSDVMPYDNTIYGEMSEEMITIWKNAFRKRLEKIKVDFDPEVVFAHHLWMLTSIVIEIFPDSKIIGICHNTDLRQANMHPQLLNDHVKNICDLDYIFSASDEQKNEIVEIYGADKNKIIALGGAFNQNIFYEPIEKNYDEKVKLVFCAKIDPSKGIYELIEVYKSLNLPDVTLDIIGNPNEENKHKINSLIKDDKSINLYNVKNQVALGDELRKKDIYLMPSYYEGLGLMAIESLACGLYVVTTEIEALMTLLGKEVKDSGVIKFIPLPRIYDTDKPVKEDLPKFKQDLRTAIIAQIEKVRDRKAFDDAIRSKIKTFSWDGLVEKTDKILKNSLS